MSVTPDKFTVTVLTVPGKVKKAAEGKFGAYKISFRNGVEGVLKQKLHSTEEFRGVPENRLHLHEVAAYQLDAQLLHFDIVPPTVLTMYRGQQASVQEWVQGMMPRDIVPDVFNSAREDSAERSARLTSRINVDMLRRVVIFDLIVNNTDRHLRNCLFDVFGKRVWAIDNGLAFGSYLAKYNNVFHRRIFRKDLQLTPEERARLEKVSYENLQRVLSRYLPSRDISMTFKRIQWVLAQPNLAWELVAKGSESKEDFPAYKDFFRRERSGQPNKILARIDDIGKLGSSLTAQVYSQ